MSSRIVSPMSFAFVEAQTSQGHPSKIALLNASGLRMLQLLILTIELLQPLKAQTGLTTFDPVCAPENANKQQSLGTRKMVGLLSRIAQDALANPSTLGAFQSDALVSKLQSELLTATNLEHSLRLKEKLSLQLLRSGQSEQALIEFEHFLEANRKLERVFDWRQRSQYEVHRAMCWLRLAEQENCLTNHNSDSCLLPIQLGGVYKSQRGSRQAMEILEAHLKKLPGDLQARWLLNIAYMTVGEYPQKVPDHLVISPKVFQSQYDIKRFQNVAANVGLDRVGLAGGSIAEDFDGDGYLDIMTSSWDLKGQLQFFHNHGNGTFEDHTIAAGLTGLTSGLSIVQTDYNNDGFPDVFIPRGAWQGAAGHHPPSLLRNNGDGTFSDVTEEAGLLSFHPSQAVTWFDFNGDGWLDLFVGNESYEKEIHPCQLYRNNGDGTFTECAEQSGVATIGYIKGVTSGDFNNDGRPDLYLSNKNGPNLLFRNEGPSAPNGGPQSLWRFTNIAVEAGVTNPYYSFSTWFFDYDNDGWLDILVTGYSVRDVSDVAADYLGLPNQGEKSKLYRNNRNGTFQDVTVEAGLDKVLLAMGSNFGDLDNDGWLDFYLGTGDPELSTLIPNRMFRNQGGQRFQDVTTSGGFGNLQKGHGVSFADIDNDGDQDVFEVVGGAFSGDRAHSVLFLNPGHHNHWITLKLEGVESNRAAIGAQICITVQTSGGQRSIYKTVGSGGSFGASPLRQEIGLGQAQSIQSITINWPSSGKLQVLSGVPMDHFYKVREGAKTLDSWPLKSFPIPTTTKSSSLKHHHLTNSP